jgi:pyrophosphatase PpaX
VKIDTLLLDLDGTLVDSNELILETFRQTFKTHFPDKRFQRADLLQMMGPPLYETFGNHTDDPALIQRMIKTYLGVYVALEFQYIRIYPGVIETLHFFHENHFHIAIVTTKFQKSAAPCLARFHLWDVVDLVVALDDVKNPKPDPEVWKPACRDDRRQYFRPSGRLECRHSHLRRRLVL